jgi:hypothetical protein
MKRTSLVLLLAMYVLPCIQAQSLGGGISIDAQGNLNINAPLYVIDKNPKKPALKPAPASMNRPVYAAFFEGEDGLNILEFTGGIVKGRLSVSIKKPDYIPRYGAADFWEVPSRFFTSGTAVEIGQLFLAIGDADKCDAQVTLFNNPQARLSLTDDVDTDTYWIDGGVYHCIYALGDISISGRVDLPGNGWTWRREFDIRLKQGWNLILETDVLDELTDIEYTKISSLPPTNAVWVLREYD